MNDDVAGAIESWLPALGLPPEPAAGVKDLRDQSVPLARFRDEETCRFFFPRRSLLFHQRMSKAIAGRLRKRGAKVVNVDLSPEGYARWCEAQGKPDAPELRFQYATCPPV